MEEELPENIVPEEVLGKTYQYINLFAMLEDIQRLRRKTGWIVVVSNDAKNLIFSMGVSKTFTLFCYEQAHLKHVDWPKTYLKIKGIKNCFTRISDRTKLVDALNAIPKDLEPGTPRSAWEHLLDDV